MRRTKIHKTVSAKSEPVWPRLGHLSREVLRPIWSVVVEVGLAEFLFSTFGDFFYKGFRIFISFLNQLRFSFLLQHEPAVKLRNRSEQTCFKTHSLWKDPNMLNHTLLAGTYNALLRICQYSRHVKHRASLSTDDLEDLGKSIKGLMR